MVNILHLSDIHFKAEEPEPDHNYRTNLLEELIKCICSFEDDYKIDLVLVTGDIVNNGSLLKDYDEALKWFNKFSNETNIPPSNFYFAPGNHDIDKNARTIDSVLDIRDNPKSADDDFSKWKQNFIPLFENYIDFCCKFKQIPYEIGKDKEPSFLTGGITIDNVPLNIVCLNSSWYHFKDKHTKGNLWLGLSLIKQMDGYQLSDKDRYNDSIITIALCHHPSDWLHDCEKIKYSDRESTWTFIKDRTHIILGGHIEGKNVFEPKQIGKRAYEVIGGATYYAPDYTHLFNILRLDNDKRSFEYYTYQYSGSTWNKVYNPDDNVYSLLSTNKECVSVHSKDSIVITGFSFGKIPVAANNPIPIEIHFLQNINSAGIKIKTTVIYKENESTISLSNNCDLQKKLNIHICYNKNTSSLDFNISLPDEMYGSTKATLLRENLFNHISYGCNIKIIYKDKVFAHGDINENISIRTSNESIELLQKVIKAEDFFKKKVNLPEELYTHDVRNINLLNQIIENDGCIEVAVDIVLSFNITYKEFKKILSNYTIYGYLYGMNEIKYSVTIGETTIPVGNRIVIYQNLKITNLEHLKQITTTLNNDDPIKLELHTNKSALLIFENYSTIKPEELIGNVSIIKFDEIRPISS